MIYMENIFVCLAAPLLIALFLTKGATRRFIGFFTLGLAGCLLAAYINSFIAAVIGANGAASLTETQAIVQLTPICEEVMKALPLFFFAAVFRPQREDVVSVSFAVGLGFATFENACHIMQYGSSDFLFALVRGFSAGVMHAVCAALLGYGLAFVYRRERRLALPSAFALLCMSATFHAIYNLLVSMEDRWRTTGYLLPLFLAALLLFFFRKIKEER